jgi:hypothetical protein
MENLYLGKKMRANFEEDLMIRRFLKPGPVVRLAVLASWICAWPAWELRAQMIALDSVTLELLKMRAAFARFEREREEFQRQRDLERLRVPRYNVELSRAIAVFHAHIADMHHRQVDCSLCRRHVKAIKDLTRRIAQAMK